MKKLLIILLIGIFVCSVRVNAICEHFGAQCPRESSCCNEGWCSSDVKSCLLGCDPLNSYSEKSCYPKPPCVNRYNDFSNLKIKNLADFSGDPNEADWTSDFTPDHSRTDGNNLLLDMTLDKSKKNEQGNYAGFGATVSSTRWMLYGTVTARIKTASTALGVVSSFIISNNTVSAIGDEIDLEWVGLNPSQVQTNFYWHGVVDYTNGEKHSIGGDSSKDYHIYTINWMPDQIQWFVDGNLIRTLTKNSTFNPATNEYKYPSTISKISFSVWDGGEGPEGTANWAGTPTDWSDPNKVYTMMIDWVNITCYQQDTEFTWPPAGYGPENTNNSTSSNPTATSPTKHNKPNGANQPDESDDDNGSSPLKKLKIPIIAVGSVVIGGAVIVLLWKKIRAHKSDPVATI